MAEPWNLRLDRDLWTPTALGTVGPYGLLRDLALGGEISYRPLLRTHLAVGRLSSNVQRSVEVLEDRAAWDRLAEPEITQFCLPGLSEKARSRWDDERTVAVVLRDRMGEQFQAIMVGRFNRFDPQVAHLETFWVWNSAWLDVSSVDDILAAGWLTLFQELARRGAVAVTAAETWTGRRFVDVLRNVAGFRPTRDVYAEVGLSAADSALVLAEWQATIEDGDVVRFGTRPELDEAAHRALLVVLDSYFSTVTQARPDDLAPAPGYRQTLSGEVVLDGAHGWGSGSPRADDWFGALSDNLPDDLDWHRRGPAALARWLEATTGE